MPLTPEDKKALQTISETAAKTGLDISDGMVRRTSSRFCLGVEHGDYNGTELFGVGTDRFIWFAYKPNNTNRVRLFSANFPNDAIVDFELGKVPEPGAAEVVDSWARFPYGVDYILRREGIALNQGLDGIIYGNIPGGGMSRSASLAINLIVTMLEVNNITLEDEFHIVELAQKVENDYIGSPCGLLDQIMIFFAKEGMGTHYNPATKEINYVPLGSCAEDFRIVVMDTGTVRPGLEKSTYKVRRTECDNFAAMLASDGYGKCLADIRDDKVFEEVVARYKEKYPEYIQRLDYIFHAQQRFYLMMKAWKAGDIVTVGKIFRKDGLGLRDDYQISGPELETMCDIVRSVDGVLGERMLGGGDKGAAGAIVRSGAIAAVEAAVQQGYPLSRPNYADKYALHTCKVVDGVSIMEGHLK